jgi:hypothetical protein
MYGVIVSDMICTREENQSFFFRRCFGLGENRYAYRSTGNALIAHDLATGYTGLGSKLSI